VKEKLRIYLVLVSTVTYTSGCAGGKNQAKHPQNPSILRVYSNNRVVMRPSEKFEVKPANELRG
jgi:hypothetical protein